MNSTLLAVGVHPAYIGVADLTRQAILPVFGSTALIHPDYFAMELSVPRPLASHAHGMVAARTRALHCLLSELLVGPQLHWRCLCARATPQTDLVWQRHGAPKNIFCQP